MWCGKFMVPFGVCWHMNCADVTVSAGASLSSDARATHQRRECGRVCGGPDPVHQAPLLGILRPTACVSLEQVRQICAVSCQACVSPLISIPGLNTDSLVLLQLSGHPTLRKLVLRFSACYNPFFIHGTCLQLCHFSSTCHCYKLQHVRNCFQTNKLMKLLVDRSMCILSSSLCHID